MRFMNEWDVQDAVRDFGHDPVLGPLARTLGNLMDWANHNSDGWAYWPKPARAANKAMEILSAAKTQYYRMDFSYVEPTPADVRKALAPIKAFRTRQGADFDIVEV